MIPHHVYYLLMVIGCLWCCIMLHYGRPSRSAGLYPEPAEPLLPKFKRKRSNESKPFKGLTQRPHSAACDHDVINSPLYHVYDNCCCPHASLRQPLWIPEPTHGRGSAKLWQPCTPTMRAGVTYHVWSLKDVLLFRVPPWPRHRWSKP